MVKTCKICGLEALPEHMKQYHPILAEYNNTGAYESSRRQELQAEIKKTINFINVASFENPMNMGPENEKLESLKNELASLGEVLLVGDRDSIYSNTFDDLESAKQFADKAGGYVMTEEDELSAWPEETAVYISPDYKANVSAKVWESSEGGPGSGPQDGSKSKPSNIGEYEYERNDNERRQILKDANIDTGTYGTDLPEYSEMKGSDRDRLKKYLTGSFESKRKTKEYYDGSDLYDYSGDFVDVNEDMTDPYEHLEHKQKMDQYGNQDPYYDSYPDELQTPASTIIKPEDHVRLQMDAKSQIPDYAGGISGYGAHDNYERNDPADYDDKLAGMGYDEKTRAKFRDETQNFTSLWDNDVSIQATPDDAASRSALFGENKKIKASESKRKASEGDTYTCGKCGKIGTDFSEMGGEECPSDLGNGHQIPIMGDLVKPAGYESIEYNGDNQEDVDVAQKNSARMKSDLDSSEDETDEFNIHKGFDYQERGESKAKEATDLFDDDEAEDHEDKDETDKLFESKASEGFGWDSMTPDEREEILMMKLVGHSGEDKRELAYNSFSELPIDIQTQLDNYYEDMGNMGLDVQDTVLYNSTPIHKYDEVRVRANEKDWNEWEAARQIVEDWIYSGVSDATMGDWTSFREYSLSRGISEEDTKLAWDDWGDEVGPMDHHRSHESHEYTCGICGDKFGDEAEYTDHKIAHDMDGTQ